MEEAQLMVPNPQDQSWSSMGVLGRQVEVTFKNIETGSYGDTWVAATVISQRKNQFLVEYQDFSDEAEKPLQEYVDFSQLRPLPPQRSCPTTQLFQVEEEVDALINYGWWKGVITEVLDENARYIVHIKSVKKECEFEHSSLRSHMDWINGAWVCSNQQDQNSTKRKRASWKIKRQETVCLKDLNLSMPFRLEGVGAMKRKKGRPKSSVKKTPGKGLEHEAVKKEMTVAQIGCTQSLIHMEGEHPLLSMNLESSNCLIVKDDRDASMESLNLLDSPNVVHRSFSLEEHTTFNGQYDNARGDETTLHHIQRNIVSSSKEQEKNGSWPFIESSYLWESTEFKRLFEFMQQKPHFRPLEEENEFLREGVAIGYMLSFGNMMEELCKAQLEEPRCKFEEKLRALTALEEHGFTVQPICNQIGDLLKIKDSYNQHKDRSKTVERDVIEEKVKLDEVQESVAQLNMKIQTLVMEKEAKDRSVDEMQNEIDAIKTSIQDVRVSFSCLAAAPWVSNQC